MDFCAIFYKFVKLFSEIKIKSKTMSSIQDIHALEERIYGIVQDYVNNKISDLANNWVFVG